MFPIKYLFLIIFLTGCAQVEKPKETYEHPEQYNQQGLGGSARPEPEEPPIQASDVMSRLRINPESLPLGFKQWPFNPCKLGVSDKKCKTHYLSVVNVRLICRDSEGTTQLVTQGELMDMSSSEVTWKLGGSAGGGETDNRGIVSISAVSPSSTKNTRLIVMKGRDSLGLKAGEAKKIILPRYWCI